MENSWQEKTEEIHPVVGNGSRSSHHDLKVWQEGLELVQGVYEATRSFPGGEKFGLTSQMRRAAVSVPSNIAEGAARMHRKEFLRFVGIARGSLMELETLWLIAKRQGLLSDEKANTVEPRLQRTFSLLCGLIRSLGDSPP